MNLPCGMFAFATEPEDAPLDAAGAAVCVFVNATSGSSGTAGEMPLLIRTA